MPIETNTSNVAADVPVVVVDELDAALESLARRAFARERKLFPRYVERLHAHAVVLGHEERQRAPAAPGFDDRVARPQTQLTADQIELRPLRLVERHLGMFEVRAGVDQLLSSHC